MSQLIEYALLLTTVNGQPMLQAEKYAIARDGKGIPVETLALGFAGLSKGSSVVTINVMGAVPAPGFEFDAGSYIQLNIPVTAVVQGPGGQSLKCPAYILKDSLEQTVNSKAGYSFDMIGPMQQWAAASGA
jgi:hypothetical protein